MAAHSPLWTRVIASLLLLLSVQQLATASSLLVESEDAPESLSEPVFVSQEHALEEELMTSEGRELQREAPGFNIAFTFASSISQKQLQGFYNARARWQSIITRDYNTRACVPAGFRTCGFRFRKRTCIDDLLIIVKVQPIDGTDGEQNILGQAGPCAFAGRRVRIGIMYFDSADADLLIQDGQWEATILHEMGHVLGLGTVWENFGLVTPAAWGAPFLYLGKNGNIGHSEVAGSGQIRVEDKYGPGTARGHWKESVYDNELMTGFLEEQGVMPLSAITVRALADIGYTVDATKADYYRVPRPGRRLRGTEPGKGKRRRFVNDVIKFKPIQLTDIHPKPGRSKRNKAEKSKDDQDDDKVVVENADA